MKGRRRRLHIGEILNAHEEILADEDKIWSKAVQHYNMQFQAETWGEYPQIKNIPKLITEEKNMLMEQIPKEEEVREAFFH